MLHAPRTKASHLLSQVGRSKAFSSPRFSARAVNFGRTKYSTLVGAQVLAHEPVTKVEKLLLDEIKATGPIPVSRYMQMCLSHPTDGYYMNPKHAVFGTQGDFVTSPEISQAFGELIGIWIIWHWVKCLKRKVRFIELGPGRGTLMSDILRTFKPFFERNTLQSIHIVETSLHMRELQQKMLSANGTSCEIKWYDSVHDIKEDAELYTVLIAHEFFDALPIHLLENTENGWREVYVDASLNLPPGSTSRSYEESPAPRFKYALNPTPTPTSLTMGALPRFKDLPVGSRVEVSLEGIKAIKKISALISHNPDLEPEDESKAGNGLSLIIDYGGEKAFGDSFRAFKDHKIVDVFHRPGECDLTANVDFTALKAHVLTSTAVHGTISQAEFLQYMGIDTRIDALARAALTDERKVAIKKAAYRLIDPTGMGSQYKVLALTGRFGEKIFPFVLRDKN